MASQLVNLANFSFAQLREMFAAMGERSFRAEQLVRWIHQRGVIDFNQMTDFSLSLRQRLIETADIVFPEITLTKLSKDGTRKWLVRLEHGDLIEMVYIPEPGRGTLCVSSQVGCSLNCSFCATGKQGFNRNLTLAEIIGQVWLAKRALDETDDKLTNVVMMGMGEPLLNFEALVAALEFMLSDYAYGLSKYRVTVSTSGLVPQMEKLRERSPVALAVSLHASRNDLRDQLVPINRHYPIEQLMSVCRDYFVNEPRRSVMFEYVMLAGVNDSDKDARDLAGLMKGVKAKVNLIPFNPFSGSGYATSSKKRIESFQNILIKANILTTVRKTRGDDVDVACGQLTGKVTDKTRRKSVD